MSEVIVIGGGAAGMLAAIAAAQNGQPVRLLEKNEKLGKKIYITGKGRCNVTNACEFDAFLQNVTVNQRFLYSSLRGFFNTDLCTLLEDAGCALKTERGERVFPVSDHASDVTKALEFLLRKNKVQICLNTEVIAIEKETESGALHKSEQSGDASGNRAEKDRQSFFFHGAVQASGVSDSSIDKDTQSGRFRVTVRTRRGRGVGTTSNFYGQNGTTAFYTADAVIVATGGLSYPTTGSSGDGYRFAEAFGLKHTATYPSLVPFTTAESDCREMQGLSLKNIAVRIAPLCEPEKIIYEDFGELLFTHFGVSGPVILSASPQLTTALSRGERFVLSIDLKPALSEEKLDERILRDFAEQKNVNLGNAVGKLLPQALRPVILRRAGLSPEKKVHDVTKEERRRLLHAIKALAFTLTGTRGFSEAVITKGGVDVSEINPKTMESKRVPGLYFAGEVLDVDALTGGFNLQIAFSTGFAAGNHIA